MATKEQTLHMNVGVGETSYANNSLLQKSAISNVKHMVEETIRRLCSTISVGYCLKVADLGCSSGPNALMVTSEIMGMVYATCNILKRQPPVFQFFLNDLPGNDFNTIFQSLPNFYSKLDTERGRSGTCFVAAMPGTFYGRLFPTNSIHFFHSSFSLHWLSQVPKGLTCSIAPLNKGNIYVTRTSPPVVYKAYLEQFQQDFELFLESRSEELVPGGVMALTFIGRSEDDQFRTTWELIGLSLYDMVSESLIEESKSDGFDVPYYAPTIEEVKEVIEAEGSFQPHRLEIYKMGWDAGVGEKDDGRVIDRQERGKFIANYMRAVAEPLLKKQFGEAIMDDLFERFTYKIVQLMEVTKLEYSIIAMSLTKGNKLGG